MWKLLRARRFGPLFWTQLWGALNDNLFKSALVAMLTFGALARSGAALDQLVNLATGLLVLPFFLFSAMAGELADRCDKAKLARILKGTELGVMLLAGLGFALNSLPLLFSALFLMGTQSAFFGPIKYAMLPQHLKEEELVGGNALIEAATFVAIVIGTLAGTLLVSLTSASAVAFIMVAIALLGLRAAQHIPVAPSLYEPATNTRPVRDALRPIATLRATLRSMRTPRLRWAILGVSAFWLVGAVLLGQLPRLSQSLAAGGGVDGGMSGEHTLALLLTLFSVGIGAGSFMAERIAHRFGVIAEGTLALAATGMALSLVGLSISSSLIGSCVALTMAGAMGGVFIVPLYAAMQRQARDDERARVIAANNLINALFMVIGAAYAAFRLSTGAPLAQLFLELALFVAALALVTLVLTLRDVLHLVFRGVVRVMYRIDDEGTDLLPESGAALIAINHESFIDGFVVGSLLRRRVRFVMDYRMSKMPLMKYLFRVGGVIPIASRKEAPEVLDAALQAIDEALANGEVVAIFPEGKCTRDGQTDIFRRGMERILEKQPVPVVPVSLTGLYGGFFSYAHGHPMTSWPRRFRSKLRLRMGAPLPPTLDADTYREHVLALGQGNHLAALGTRTVTGTRGFLQAENAPRV